MGQLFISKLGVCSTARVNWKHQLLQCLFVTSRICKTRLWWLDALDIKYETTKKYLNRFICGHHFPPGSYNKKYDWSKYATLKLGAFPVSILASSYGVLILSRTPVQEFHKRSLISASLKNGLSIGYCYLDCQFVLE